MTSTVATGPVAARRHIADLVLAVGATRRDRADVRRCAANRAAGGCRAGRGSRWCVGERRRRASGRFPRGSSRCRCGRCESGASVRRNMLPSVAAGGGGDQGQSDIFYTTRVLEKRALPNKDLRRKRRVLGLISVELGMSLGSMKMELPEIRPEERTPLVEALLGIIRQLLDRVAELEADQSEIARRDRPAQRARSRVPRSSPARWKRRKPPKHQQTPRRRAASRAAARPPNSPFTTRCRCTPTDLPAGATFKGYEAVRRPGTHHPKRKHPLPAGTL